MMRTKEEMEEIGAITLPPSILKIILSPFCVPFLLTQTLDSRPLTLDRREKTEVWCLPARSRFGEGRSEVDCLKWCLKSEVPPQVDLNCRSSLRRLDDQRRNERNKGRLSAAFSAFVMAGKGVLLIKPERTVPHER